MESFNLDRELLAKVVNTKGFLESVFYRDSLDDWSLAKDLGQFLVRLEPDSDVIGHALLARAYRHLGDLGRARDELTQCKLRVANRELKPLEIEFFLPFLAEEEKLLSP
jgi:hypothetical protein